MITELFLALRVQAINSQTFANGYYHEYSLEGTPDGVRRVTRRLRNRYEFSNAEPATAVETPEQIEACKQALIYNFPHAFNIDGSVAIDLPELPEPTTPDTTGNEQPGEASVAPAPDATAETGAGDEAEAEQEVGGLV